MSTISQNIENNANNTLETLIRRFTSSNTIPVERTNIKKEEFELILQYISLLKNEIESPNAS